MTTLECEQCNRLWLWRSGNTGCPWCEIERLRGVMKAVASMPGQQWLIGQLALAKALSGAGGEHLDYVLSLSRAARAAGEECDHKWETVDHSYDHAHGCEQIVMDVCAICGAERPHNTQRLDDDVI